MANKQFGVNIELEGNNEIVNLKADTIDVGVTNPALFPKKIAYSNGFYYYSDGTSWLQIGIGTGNNNPIYAQSTGVVNGGFLSVGNDNTKFSISDGSGLIVKNTVAPYFYKKVTWTGLSEISATYVNSSLVSYVAIDENGIVIQQITPFTQSQNRDLIVLGSLIHVNLTNLDTTNNFQEVAISPSLQVGDLSRSLGIFNISGNAFSPNGANLQINKSLGLLYSYGSNWVNDSKNPSRVSLNSLTALTFQYRFQNGTNGVTGTNINPNIYDVGGASTPVPTNKFTVQRIYSFVSNNVKIQPGQTLYNSLNDAKAGIGVDPFITENSISQNGLLRAFLIVQEGVTNLSNISSAQIIDAGKFGQGSGAGTSGGGGVLKSIQLPLGTIISSGAATSGFALDPGPSPSGEMTYQITGANPGTSKNVWFQFAIPKDYISGGTFRFSLKRSQTITNLTATAYTNGTISSGINNVSIQPGNNNVYEITSASFNSNKLPNDSITLRLDFTGSNGMVVNFRFLTFEYSS